MEEGEEEEEFEAPGLVSVHSKDCGVDPKGPGIAPGGGRSTTPAKASLKKYDFGPSESKSPGGLRSVQLGRDPGWGTKTVVFTCWRCGMGQNPRCLSLVGGGTESKK